jgi:hypothetical protein
MKEDIEMLHLVASILLGVQAGSPLGVGFAWATSGCQIS